MAAPNSRHVDRASWSSTSRSPPGEPGPTYEDLIEEALCFGWIDGTARSVDDRRTSLYFCPRRKGSVWAASNKARVERLLAGGLMSAGRRGRHRAGQGGRLVDDPRPQRVPRPFPASWLAPSPGIPAAATRSTAFPPSTRKQLIYWVDSRQAAGDHGATSRGDRAARSAGHPGEPATPDGLMTGAHRWVDATVAALVPLADPDRAAPMRAYMKDVSPFLGIDDAGSATGAAIGLARSCRRCRRDEVAEVSRALWALPEREYQYAACDLLARRGATDSGRRSSPTRWRPADGPAVVGHRRLARHGRRSRRSSPPPRPGGDSCGAGSTRATAGSSAPPSSTSAASRTAPTSIACSRCATGSPPTGSSSSPRRSAGRCAT